MNKDDKNKYGKIEFKNFKSYMDGTGFECTVKADDHQRSDVIFFKFNKPIGNISNNLIFVALMTLVGKDWYENAYFELSVSKHIFEKALLVSKTNIKVKDFNYEEDEDKRESYDGSVLNLSGGIDSNALFYLLKRGGVDFHAISTDFGTDYIRDSEVCKGRTELVLKTNIRNKDTFYVSDRKTWEFMGIATLLTVDYFKTKNILFGQVNQYDRYLRCLLENQRNRELCVQHGSFSSMCGCDTYGIQFLTEFQNAIVLLDNVHDVELLKKIEDASATNRHFDKFLRKQMFLLVARKFLNQGNIDYSQFKFMNENDKMYKKFIDQANSVTVNDKNLVLPLGLKYLGYVPQGYKNKMSNDIKDFSFIDSVYVRDLPEFYSTHKSLIEYLASLFKIYN